MKQRNEIYVAKNIHARKQCIRVMLNNKKVEVEFFIQLYTACTYYNKSTKFRKPCVQLTIKYFLFCRFIGSAKISLKDLASGQARSLPSKSIPLINEKKQEIGVIKKNKE